MRRADFARTHGLRKMSLKISSGTRISVRSPATCDFWNLIGDHRECDFRVRDSQFEFGPNFYALTVLITEREIPHPESKARTYIYIDLFTSSLNSVGWGRHFRKVPLKTRRVFRADTPDGRKWLAPKANLFSGNACAFLPFARGSSSPLTDFVRSMPSWWTGEVEDALLSRKRVSCAGASLAIATALPCLRCACNFYFFFPRRARWWNVARSIIARFSSQYFIYQFICQW